MKYTCMNCTSGSKTGLSYTRKADFKGVRVLGYRMQLERRLGDDRQGALGAYQQTGNVVPCGGFPGSTTGLDYSPVRLYMLSRDLLE